MPGYESQHDEYDHVLDPLGADIRPHKRMGLVNEGLGGDSLYVALPARDGFAQAGVTGVIIYDVNGMNH